MQGKVIFISGIDTDVGKTVATGMLAKKLMLQGFSVITQKMIQTGCRDISEDILLHRKIQGIELTEEDHQGITCPYLFSYPCSPHLAAKLENVQILPEKIQKSTALLSEKYDYVLIEGAGGLMVPYYRYDTTMDYLAARGYPLVLVCSGKLGSINHSLLSLEVCKQRNIRLQTLIYNQYPDEDKLIAGETRAYLQDYLALHFPQASFEVMPPYAFTTESRSS
ncbi:dethiobiotin synthase [Mesocricetibacter intestinalis]|uniref:ATP-dependent dethiobiotin synthetase BioD n=1 Tax=Mesocricetibacter intestinalis TaxID=1521930 RepID=A0A4R6VC88_9PAST|nr:dethiobiotin synthase [Mesocricetibacter intestinalis]TDQ58036.1 dethiobiotin synthase [Mesocricetibacter intestinalis]